MTWLVARGMVCEGSSASAAVMPTSSRPPNENITTAIAMTRPETPCGKNPPLRQRFETLASGPAEPETSSQPPNPIMPTIASTLMIANQNSSSPYDLTLVKLMPLMTTKNTSAETHVGNVG